jgi:hypothetical protein
MSPVLLIFAAALAIGLTAYVFGFNPLGGILGKLTAGQIAQYASNAGFSGDDLRTAVAIALAESDGDPKAHGDTSLGSGTGSFGLWQVYADAHPEFGPDFTGLYDPATNAQAAYQIFVLRGSFRDWSTFDPKDGSTPKYLAFLSQVDGAISV